MGGHRPGTAKRGALQARPARDPEHGAQDDEEEDAQEGDQRPRLLGRVYTACTTEMFRKAKAVSQ